MLLKSEWLSTGFASVMTINVEWGLAAEGHRPAGALRHWEGRPEFIKATGD
jgi:hypothetical protein